MPNSFTVTLAETAPKIIVEVGCNHQGDFQSAVAMLQKAAECGADAVKFQKRDIASHQHKPQYSQPHPNPVNAFGPTYREHREFLEFSIEQHQELKKLTEELGLEYSCSVWDQVSAAQLSTLEPNFIKVPSAANGDRELLNQLCRQFGSEIHISLGMTTTEEETRLLEFFDAHGRLQDLVLYSCVSSYPSQPQDLSLLEIVRLNQQHGSKLMGVGFSGHHLGVAQDMAAVALGAAYIERHFTLDKTQKGTDHEFSLCPAELEALVKGVKDTWAGLRFKKTGVLDSEEPFRLKLKV